MAKIAFILLCHKEPDAIIAQANALTAKGDCIAIHFDARAKSTDYAEIRAALDDNPNVTFARKRIKCGWGEWSLVAATLEAVRAAVEDFPRATHFYMLSGDCAAIKSASYAHKVLDQQDVDYIESFDFFSSDWIKTGMKEDRLIYRHWFNERKNKWLFYKSVEFQEKFGLKRDIPQDLQMMIGSQWWCLRRRTVEWVLEFADERPDVMRFFRTTWIPDETFFQTIVRHVVPAQEIRTRTLTFLMFTDYGMPVTFLNDHYDLLLSQNFLFARKISPDAADLQSRLSALYASDRLDFQTSDEGRTLFKFLTGRGRIGRRFASRFWEQQSTLGRDRELLIIACKKWHVAKRLLDRISELTDIRNVEYLFDEEETTLPDLGGIESSLEKRSRHKRAFVRLLYDALETSKLIICLDPSNLDLMHDFQSDKTTTRILEIDCDFTDDYLHGHAMRVGLAGEMTSQDTINRLLPTIRQEFGFEAEQMRDADFTAFFQIGQTQNVEKNALALAEFLGTREETAQQILSIDYLFED